MEKNRSSVFLLMLSLSLQACVSSFFMDIKDDFIYCAQNQNQDKILQVVPDCDLFKSSNATYGLDTKAKAIYVLAKAVNGVIGEAHECFREEFAVTTKKTFFGMEHVDTSKRSVYLHRVECEMMVATNKSGQETMKCEGTVCEYESEIKPEFHWLSTRVTSGFRCKLTKRKIVAKDANTVVFDKCLVSDLQCNLTSSIVIWQKSAISDCPYTLVSDLKRIDLLKGTTNVYVNNLTRHAFID